eukprot:362607-Chlamydomonas_euryale.AAC.8
MCDAHKEAVVPTMQPRLSTAQAAAAETVAPTAEAGAAAAAVAATASSSRPPRKGTFHARKHAREAQPQPGRSEHAPTAPSDQELSTFKRGRT